MGHNRNYVTATYYEENGYIFVLARFCPDNGHCRGISDYDICRHGVVHGVGNFAHRLRNRDSWSCHDGDRTCPRAEIRQ